MRQNHLPFKAKHYSNFSFIERSRKAKSVAITLFLSMVYQLGFPNISYALTSGPANPDFSSFEPVATTNMVNEFTGQFVYNLPVLDIPGANGGGYALSLSYHSGDGPESDASWVGFGWSLNPGSINRNKRGLPDDYNGNSVTYYNQVHKNWTVAVTGQAAVEAFSSVGLLGLSAYTTVRYNYYKGFGLTNGVGLSALSGTISLGYNLTDGNGYFSVSVNPANLLSATANIAKSNDDLSGVQADKQTPQLGVAGVGQSMEHSVEQATSSIAGSITTNYVNYLLTSSSSPYNLTPFSGSTFSGYVSLTGDPPPFPTGFSVGVNVSYTQQTNEGIRNVPAFGYMYSGNTPDNDSASTAGIMDYTVENPTTYNTRDKFLPVPFSTPDAYTLSGEGLGGGFRMYNTRIGIFSPNYVESHTSLSSFSLDTHAGLDNGFGGDIVTDGSHVMKVHSAWTNYDNGNTDDYKFLPPDFDDSDHVVNEDNFFRFNNDLGGKVVYDNSDTYDPPVITGNLPELPDFKNVQGGSHGRSGRSSYIGYRTNRELKVKINNIRALAYGHISKVRDQAGTDNPLNNGLDDEIGEISTVNEAGNRYVYGLPVYNAEDKSIMRGLSDVKSNDNYLVAADVSNDNQKVGEQYNTPYPSSYLLTQITTPDYLDVNLNGPDTADFGGYTKFIYRRAIGTDNKNDYLSWYKWRTPYNSLYYQPAALSDKTDDMGSYQSGYKEVYYLDTIETKTHYAVFVTDTNRSDGYDAPASDDQAADSSLVNNPVRGNNHMEKLSKILLFAKSTHAGEPDRLIKTVHFEYDYECWPRTPNSTNGAGKLTLKRVWFEYNGVVNAGISPYVFDYTYPTSVAYPPAYQYIQNEMSALSQTPAYIPYIDCWGNYQYDGYNRRHNYQCWDSQVPASDFDPAAWQLKRITLPSGGEIHVQYEQNTYSYVQDKNACSLVSLTNSSTDLATGSKYYLNTNDLGITSTADKQRLASLISNMYNNSGSKKIFFKFFYTLEGHGVQNFDGCNGDYVSGYVNFVSSGVDANGVYVQVGGGLPHQVCLDYVHDQVGGKLYGPNCNAGVGINQPGLTQTDMENLGHALVNRIASSFAGSLNYCLEANPQFSYLRIPVFKKLGGGIRVKRLMMYNKGVDVNNPTLYGTEYIYDNESDGTSYGVATNEPYDNKGENPLVDILIKRDDQTWGQKLLAGKDREQFEGPLGMNALPAPSIGYSRIIKKNIFQSKNTGNGYTVVDYYTAKDYPFMNDNNDGNYSILQKVKDNYHVDFGIFAYDVNTGIRTAQGYCFTQNQMHGQLKAIANYPGMYDPVKFYDTNNPPSPVTQTTYTYFQPGEAIPMYDFNNWNIYYDYPGKETDITVDRRGVEEDMSETRITGDITLGSFAFVQVLYPVALPLTTSFHSTLNSIVSNKVIHYPAILKSVSVMKDGYTQRTDNVAFDPLTTRPVVTRTYDGYDGLHLPDTATIHNGSYTTYDVPASSHYEGMGQKAWNESYCYYDNDTMNVVHDSSGYLFSHANSMWMFYPGDQVALFYKDAGLDYVAIGNVTSLFGNSIIVQPALRYNDSIPMSGKYYKVEVLKSGHTNQLLNSMNGFTTYGEMHLPICGLPQIFLDTFNNHIYRLLQNNQVDPLSTSDTIYAYPFCLRISNMDNYEIACGLPNTFIDRFVILKSPMTSSVIGNYRHYTYNYKSSSGPVYIYDISAVLNSNPPPPSMVVLGDTAFSGLLIRVHSNDSGWKNGPGIPIFKNPPSHVNVSLVPHVNATLTLTDSTTSNTNGQKAYWYCGDSSAFGRITKASILNYAENLNTDTFGYHRSTHLNDYEAGRLGKWHPFQTYVYRDTVTNGSQTLLGQRVYKDAGTALFIFETDWPDMVNIIPDKWINTNTTSQYSPNGEATEEYDPQYVYSAAKYGYYGMLPYMIAQNAKVASVHFESFENVYSGSIVEDNMHVNSSHVVKGGHTGEYGYNLYNGEQLTLPVTLDNIGGGLILRFWAQVTGNPATTFSISASPSSSSPMVATQIARSGAWALYEAKWVNPIGPNTSTTITIQNNSGSNYMIDDIRVQPTETKSTCYVYDIGTYKLSAVLDDQLFATYYQYNGEGKLVRTIVETVRGIKTVEEAQYHLPLVPWKQQ